MSDDKLTPIMCRVIKETSIGWGVIPNDTSRLKSPSSLVWLSKQRCKLRTSRRTASVSAVIWVPHREAVALKLIEE